VMLVLPKEFLDAILRNAHHAPKYPAGRITSWGGRGNRPPIASGAGEGR
jgi:hypothetical protein